MREVLEAGPWFFGSRPLVLKPWTIDMDMDKIQDYNYPMWVQFPNLRLNLWSSVGISKIASFIGYPITTDKLTATRERLSYARVLLEVKLPLKDPLPDEIIVQGPDGESYKQSVLYKLKPRWCSLCNILEHETEKYRRKKNVNKKWIPVNKQPVKDAPMNQSNVQQQDLVNKEGPTESVGSEKNEAEMVGNDIGDTPVVEKQIHERRDNALGVSPRMSCLGAQNATISDNLHVSGKHAQNVHMHILGASKSQPSVNTTGFTSATRAIVARRVFVNDPRPSIQASHFSILDHPTVELDPSSIDRGSFFSNAPVNLEY
ncbi:uncharacterized protein LOC109842429 [Asparagus officinalis]|uniref:uncharacterized protein LOC109842429 n=1 Tax=Asparagus officinalis TaxID=4686 RepID=UPI00098E50CD|nr:uncharacterized protein LOC109842429 [Asparagus officinalis]